MPEVIFTADAELKNAAGEVVERYLTGEVHDLPMDKCRRWVKRERAEFYSGQAPRPTVAKAEAGEQSDAFDKFRQKALGTEKTATPAHQESGPEKPSSVSQAAPVLTSETSNTFDAQESAENAESSQSTAPSTDADGQTPSTAQTPHSGGRRKTHKRSKA